MRVWQELVLCDEGIGDAGVDILVRDSNIPPNGGLGSITHLDLSRNDIGCLYLTGFFFKEILIMQEHWE